MTHSLTTGAIKRGRILRAFSARRRRYIDFLHTSSPKIEIGFGANASTCKHRQHPPTAINATSTLSLVARCLTLGAQRRTRIESPERAVEGPITTELV